MTIRKIVAVILMAVLLMPAMAFAETSADEWWNVLLLGSDDHIVNQYTGRTDTIIILSMNRESGEMKMTSVMRDTWVNYGSGKANKINAMNVFGGPELAMQVINENLGLDIQHYCVINMASLVDIIDMIGGVDIEITDSERKYANHYIEDYLRDIEDYPDAAFVEEIGLVHLNGLQAVAFLRNRYTDSDFGRVMRNQKVMIAAANQVQNMEVDALMEKADEFFAHIVTNMTAEELKELAMLGLTVETSQIGQFRVPVDGTYESGTFDGTWMIRADMDANKPLIREFIYGE